MTSVSFKLLPESIVESWSMNWFPDKCSRFVMSKKPYFIHLMKFIGALWLTMSLGAVYSAGAQALHDPGIQLTLTDPVPHARNGDLLALTLKIENNGERPFEGFIRAQLPEGMIILSPLAHDTIRLEPKSKRFVSLRIRVQQSAASGEAVITLHIGRTLTQIDAQTSFNLNIDPHRQVQLMSPDQLKLMRHLHDSVRVNVQLRNTGNIDEVVNLVSSVPTFSGSRSYQKVNVQLPAGTDTTVNLGFVVDKELLSLEQFQYTIVGTFDDQKVFGNLSISVQNASSSRQFQDRSAPLLHWGQRHNRISLSSRNSFSGNQSRYMDANLQFQNQSGQWELNSHLYQFGTLEQVPVLTNTWLGYTRDKWNFTAGQIIENAEKHIQGRGGRVAYRDSLNNHQFAFGLVDKSYDLLNQYGRHGLGSGWSAFSNFEAGGLRRDQGLKYKGQLLYDRDPMDNTESIIHSSTLPLIQKGPNSSTYLALDLGAGISRPLQDTLNQLQTEPGLALGVNYDQEIGRFYIQSTNYYSSAHYPGIRRGTINLHQRFGVRFPASNIWLGYRRFQYEPGSFMPNQRPYFMMSEETEAGATWQLSPFSSLSLIPQRYREKNTSFAFSQTEDTPLAELNAYRGKGVFSWRSRNNNHYLHVNVEGSVTQDASKSIWDTGYRSSLNYNFWKFNLNLHYQSGAFSVFDVTNMAVNETDEVSRMIGALNFNYFSKRSVQAYAGLQYYQDNFTGSSISGNIRTDWRVGPQTALFAQAQYYHYRASTFGSQQSLNFLLGVSQSLQGLVSREKTTRGTLEIQVYYDENGNQQFDPGEKIAIDKSVLIGKSLFLTDSEGWITYRKVPYGTHEI